MKPIKLEYAVGQHVAGKVEKLLPYGVFIRLDDGTQAYIRRREVTWAGNIDPRHVWKPGDEIGADVIALAAPGQSLELSYRLTLPDPWSEFAARHQNGDVIEGAVKSITEYGVFVEVKPGVDGLVPAADLTPWKADQPEALVWPGDRIEAVITALDVRARKLRLSIRARMRQLEIVAGIMNDCDLLPQIDLTVNQPDLFSRMELAGEESKPHMEMIKAEPAQIERVGPILVVDDSDEIRRPLAEWLRHQGYTVDEAHNAEAALEKVERSRYGVLLVDLHLPGIDGLALLNQLQQSHYPGCTVLMSAAEWLAERSQEIEQAGVVEALVKPLDLSEIEQLLAKIGRGEPIPSRPPIVPAPVTVPQSYHQLAAALQSRGSLAWQFSQGLAELVATTPATTGLIFQLDPISRTVSVMAQAGQADLNEEALYGLGESPVSDVMTEAVHILENNVSGQASDRFRKLLHLLPFESCLGIPIEARGEIHHALFLLHDRSDAFTRYHLRDTLAAGALFAVAIERDAMEERFGSINKIMLSGQLAGGFSHEVYNKMSGLEIQLHNLRLDCQRYNSDAGQPADFGEISQAAEALLTTFDDLRQTVELFQQLMRSESGCWTTVNDIVQQAVHLLQPVLRKNRIEVEADLSDELPMTIVNVVQLKQAFLNIMLNAVQQMMYQPGDANLLTITTAYQRNSSNLPLKIRFTDTGPGIHRRLWERVFGLGFTTRMGGTGQGLYITRSLIESQGGRVSIERSVMLLGTTFLVELPVAMAEEA
ncbi:MAG TPA: S1 RNA-binding domain-containing protein [Anaerolineae bacterium]|nr:S1 RNA-binding domain-containing protein [Anaerolineae bacterium]